MFSPFRWLFDKAESAVLNGVASAINKLSQHDEPPQLTLAEVGQRLALPAPEAEEPKRKSK